MRPSVTTIGGSLLLIAGCLASLYLLGAATNAHLRGIFSTIISDAPSNRFAAFRCPRLLGRHESGIVSVSITNPTGDRLEYAVRITPYGFQVDSPAPERRVTLSGGQVTTLAWKVTAMKVGNQAIAVDAVSDADSALPGPFHMWPTSFREGCGVFVLDLPLTGVQMIGLSAASLVAGALLTLPWLMRRWFPRLLRRKAA